MASTFEDRLIAASSREIFNAGKLLLKQGKLSGAFREADGGIRAIFNDNKRYVRCMVRIGDTFVSECDCEGEAESDASLCPHAVAAILYNANFASGRPMETPDTTGTYAGMRRESLTELLARARIAPKAQVFLRAESEFPHVPSKWENSLLNVRLKSAQREYVGSINNLRQLYFDKALAITLKFDDFSLQDRQIIQFLAINAEPGESHLMMNSEVTAEFFHCLGGFDRFTRNGRRLVIHDIPARAAILHVKNAKDDFYTPGLIYNQAPLPLSAAKVIVGRAGCWVGRDGEYFFVPASIEVNWLRNFFRLGEQRDGDQAMLALLDGKQGMLPVVEIDSAALAAPPLQSVIGGRRDETGALRIRLQYFYDDVLLPADGGHIAVSGKKFFQRNEKSEFELENSLKMLKCECAGDEFVIADPEVQGMFLDEMLPDCVSSERRVMVSDSILKLCGRSLGVADVVFKVKYQSTLSDGFRLSGELSDGAGSRLPLLSTVRQLRRQRRYFVNSAGQVVKVAPELAALLTALENVTAKIDEKNGTFDLPFHQIHFYRYLAEKLPFAVPPELCGFGAGIHPANAAEAPGFKFEGALRSYQAEGVEWMRSMAANNFNFILADEMGLGKTVQLLALIAGLRHRGDEPAMVICPASLVENWVRECNRFVPEFRTVGLAGGEREQVYEHIADYDFIAISYATARHDADRLKKLRFSFLALDEAQHIKNADTANFQSCKALNAVHRAVLTGTPLENSPEDLWSLFEFLHPGFLGSFNSFKARYANLHGDPARQKELAARVAPFIKRRLKVDVCRELPPKHEQLLMCEMGAAQRELYNEVRELGRAQLKNLKPGEKRVPFEILTTLLRLRQICCHPPLVGAAQVDSAKMELAKELILEHIDSGSRMLLFSQFTSLLSYIRAWLEEQSIKYEYLDGSTRNRQQKVDEFNNSPDIPIFLLSLKAGGTGLNLTGADTVIIYDPWWNPAVEEQASDRTHRIGQTKPVSSLKLLVKDSIEERILAMKKQKQEIFDSVIENPELSSDKLSIKELTYLFG